MMRSSNPAVLFVLPALVLLTACASWWPGQHDPQSYTEQELVGDMAGFAARFASVVTASADEIADLTDSRRARRSTLVWKIRLIPLVQELAFDDDPREAYVLTLGLTKAMHDYLSVGDGRAIFGEHQPIAVKAAYELEAVALSIGPRFLDAEQMQRLDGQLEDLAQRFPIRGPDFSVETAQSAIVAVESGSAGLGWVTGIPLSPFRALEGVGATGVAMLEINRTALEIAEIVDELPRQNRWQIELLLYDIEERDTVTAGLSAFEQMAASADRVSLAIDRLPDDLRVALSDTQGALAEANQVLLSAQQLMQPISETVAEAGRITALLAQMQGDEGGAAEPGRPFDILEYEATLREAGSTVTELRGLLSDLDDVLESGRLEGTILQTVAGTEDELSELIESAKLAFIQVLLIFFALLLAYRFLALRIARRAG